MRTFLNSTAAQFLILAFVAAGCGNGQAFLSGGVCGDGASAAGAVSNLVANCQAQDSSFAGGFSPCFDVGACDTNLKSCSSSDKDIFEAVAACQNEYANSGDCSFARFSGYQTCALAATTLTDGGNAISAACASQFASNPGACSIPDAGS